jgi:hypothetical protein
MRPFFIPKMCCRLPYGTSPPPTTPDRQTKTIRSAACASGHDRSNRQFGVTAALAAAQDAGSISEAERLSRHLTMGANEPAAPASLLQVGGAGRVVGKKSLKLWESGGGASATAVDAVIGFLHSQSGIRRARPGCGCGRRIPGYPFVIPTRLF